MRFVRNIVALLCLVALLAAGLVAERFLGRGTAFAVGAPLIPVPPETVVGLSWDVEAPNGALREMTLRREGEFWRMGQPYPETLCDAAAVVHAVIHGAGPFVRAREARGQVYDALCDARVDDGQRGTGVHGDGIHVFRDAEALGRRNDLRSVHVADCVIPETDAEIRGKPVAAHDARHGLGCGFARGHALDGIVVGAAPVAVEHFGGIPAVLVAVRVVVVRDEEHAAAVLHELQDGGLLAGLERDVCLRDDEYIEIGKVRIGDVAVLAQLFYIIPFIRERICKVREAAIDDPVGGAGCLPVRVVKQDAVSVGCRRLDGGSGIGVVFCQRLLWQNAGEGDAYGNQQCEARTPE